MKILLPLVWFFVWSSAIAQTPLLFDADVSAGRVRDKSVANRLAQLKGRDDVSSPRVIILDVSSLSSHLQDGVVWYKYQGRFHKLRVHVHGSGQQEGLWIARHDDGREAHFFLREGRLTAEISALDAKLVIGMSGKSVILYKARMIPGQRYDDGDDAETDSGHGRDEEDPAGLGTNKKRREPFSTTKTSSNPEIRVFVGYTQSAVTAAGGLTVLADRAHAQIALLNQSFVDSRVSDYGPSPTLAVGGFGLVPSATMFSSGYEAFQFSQVSSELSRQSNSVGADFSVLFALWGDYNIASLEF